MSQFTIVLPEYGRTFHCLGSACTENCCGGWLVPVDRGSLEKYRSLPAGRLRAELDDCILENDPVDQELSLIGPASIRMLPSGVCPLLTEDRLCRIQKELGSSWLSQTCAQYPRRVHRIDGMEGLGLALSCPEAARRVLLDPELRTSPVRRHSVRWDPSVECGDPLRTFYWPIREFVTALVTERSYALWQRLFLIGIFCQRLDAIARGFEQRTFPEFLRDFSTVVASGSLRTPMDAIPSNPGMQLQLVLRLVDLGVSGTMLRPSAAACLSAFHAGIGTAEASTPESRIRAYVDGAATLACFFRDRPWMLENYLVNDFVTWVFPFGETLFKKEAPADFMGSFEQLVVRFGIFKGLLTGVARARGEAFGDTDVVQTATVASRQFEHSHSFLEASHEFLRENNLGDLAGLTTLLRN